jgi:predicted ArsR family transcriptional regulator
MTAVPSPSPLRLEQLSRAARRVYDTIVAERGDSSVASLAAALEVHPNTVRQHVAHLVTEGFVIESVGDERRPGRPGYRYRVAPGAPVVDDATAYRHLAGVLATAVTDGVPVREAGRVAGAAQPGIAGAGIDGVVDALAAHGFAPELAANGDEVVLAHCPYAELVARDPQAICALHLGLVEGFADAAGDVKVTGLDVVAPTGGCRVHLSKP